MPHATSQEKQNQVVDLYKQGKTYAQITAATGVQGPVIAEIVNRSGVPKRKQKSTPAPSVAVAQTVPATGPTALPSPAPAAIPSDLSEFQPPPPPVSAKPSATKPVQCANCHALFVLDPGEDPKTTPCPKCGVA